MTGRGDRKLPLAARFYRSVTVGSPVECWNWQGTVISNGYGQMGGADSRKAAYAHRISYELHHGPIPDGMYVCHSCDNKRCVNPNHLWAGTPTDNCRDAREKGIAPKRNPRKGSRHHWAKLTEDAVRAILSSGMSATDSARMWGVSHGTTWGVLNRKTWKHVIA